MFLIFWLLFMFCSLCPMHCLCVNVYCTTATGVSTELQLNVIIIIIIIIIINTSVYLTTLSEGEVSSKMSLHFYQITRCHSAGNRNMHGVIPKGQLHEEQSLISYKSLSWSINTPPKGYLSQSSDYATGWAIRSWIVVRVWDFSLLQNDQPGFGPHPAPISESCGSFPGVKLPRLRSRQLTFF
jgi:hypothetical protein